MAYLYGKLVTPLEQQFMAQVYKQEAKLANHDLSRLEQVKLFKAIKSTAERRQTSIQNAYTILNNNKRFASELSAKSEAGIRYTVDKEGDLCKVTKRGRWAEFSRKLTPEEIDELMGKEKKPEGKIKKFFGKIGARIKSLFVLE